MKDIVSLLNNNQLGKALQLLQSKLQESGNASLREVCDNLLQEYHYMIQFFMTGGKDPMRKAMFTKLIERTLTLTKDVEWTAKIDNDTNLSALRKSMEASVLSNNVIVEKLNDKTIDAKERYEILSQVFLQIFLSMQWKSQDYTFWSAYIVSPNTDSIVSQTIVSAIMLSCRESFCPNKYRTLIYSYIASEDEAVKQRALVGCGILLDKASDHDDLLKPLLESEETKSEILKLMMQIIVCTEVDKDTEFINRTIMPNLMKQSDISTLMSDDIIKKDKDPLDDILNPGREEKEMENVEKSVNKMLEMQKLGSDIFYSGFSKMKRYPYFYKLVNWFTPFDYDHPDLSDAKRKIGSIITLDHIYKNGPFCDSDKYSFTLGFASVIGSIPENITQMLKNGEVGPLGTLPQGEERVLSSDYVRRMYLQDLYRFYTLCPLVKLSNIFTADDILSIFKKNGILETYQYDFCQFLLRHKNIKLVSLILEDKKPSDIENLEQALLYAAYWSACHYDRLVLDAYDIALMFDPDNIIAIRGAARYSYLMEQYDKSAYYYEILKSKFPEKRAYEINYVKAMIQNGQAESMVNEAYKLDFTYADDNDIKRLLAWTLLCSNRLKQAEELYRRIVSGEYGDVSLSDRIGLLELYIVSGDTSAANSLILEIINIQESESSDTTKESILQDIYDLVSADFELLSKYYSISDIDTIILMDGIRGI